jgi:hypothetical protein
MNDVIILGVDYCAYMPQDAMYSGLPVVGRVRTVGGLCGFMNEFILESNRVWSSTPSTLSVK